MKSKLVFLVSLGVSGVAAFALLANSSSPLVAVLHGVTFVCVCRLWYSTGYVEGLEWADNAIKSIVNKYIEQLKKP